jgi:hypothetical protein
MTSTPYVGRDETISALRTTFTAWEGELASLEDSAPRGRIASELIRLAELAISRQKGG